MRTTEEVFLDHLDLAQRGDVETDIERNFAPDCVLLTTYGTFRGHDGIRDAARLLHDQVGESTWSYHTKVWHGEVAFLEWTAETEKARIPDGADSFLIRDGLVRVMTIHYTVQNHG
ncbi:MAG: nuclear transport factor 2 family protein [Thermoanaerobaculia bacterium]